MKKETDDKMMAKEILDGKIYLKKSTSRYSAVNLYDVLSDILTEVLSERPANAVDLLHNYFKIDKTPSNSQDGIEDNKMSVVAKMQLNLFKKPAQFKETDNEQDDNFEVSLPNCSHLAYVFELAGMCLGREEMLRILLALRQLTRDYSLSTVRFWGKIFGIESNYFIAEVEFTPDEKEFREDGAEPNAPSIEPIEIAFEVNDVGPLEVDDFPKPNWSAPVPLPKESHHTGTNKKVYFVCNEIGEKWVRLPHVLPIEIQISRQITKLLTGRLNAPVISSPPFPGNETNYLRAIIGRITASTQICPMGYYTFGEEDEDDDEEEKDVFTVNSEYVGLSLGELVDPSMQGWIHTSQYILPQGRCVWLDPTTRAEHFDEEEFDDDYDHERGTLSETGPRLLSTVAEDKNVETTCAWSTFLSSKILPRYAVAVARSNIWPGAHAFAMEKMCENLYIGWGKKYSANSYTPARPGTTADEYPYGPEVTEIEDPDIEMEKAMKELEVAAMRAADELDENVQEEEEDED